jgi:transcriptional regulator with XRE-family HTH domain
MDVAERLGENLARARRHADLSQEELGVRASLHRTEISLLERGARLPRIDTVIKLARALDVPLDVLIDGIAWTPGSTILGSFRLATEDRERRGGTGASIGADAKH